MKATQGHKDLLVGCAVPHDARVRAGRVVPGEHVKQHGVGDLAAQVAHKDVVMR